jgi:HEAT repeat protein
VLARVRRSQATALLTLVLSCRGPEAKIPQLIADLQSADPEVSGKASLALLEIGEPAVPPLVEMLESDDVRKRSIAATTLWGLGARGRAAVPALAATLRDPHDRLRVAAAMALENVGPAAEPAVPALVRALGDRDPAVRQWSAKALGNIGPAAEEAVPALVEAARAEGIRQSAEEAIRKIRAITR